MTTSGPHRPAQALQQLQWRDYAENDFSLAGLHHKPIHARFIQAKLVLSLASNAPMISPRFASDQEGVERKKQHFAKDVYSCVYIVKGQDGSLRVLKSICFHTETPTVAGVYTPPYQQLVSFLFYPFHAVADISLKRIHFEREVLLHGSLEPDEHIIKLYGYNLAFMQLPQTGKHMHRLSMLMEYAPYGVSQSVCRNLIISQLIR